jgi:hypothetical protein
VVNPDEMEMLTGPELLTLDQVANELAGYQQEVDQQRWKLEKALADPQASAADRRSAKERLAWLPERPRTYTPRAATAKAKP